MIYKRNELKQGVTLEQVVRKFLVAGFLSLTLVVFCSAEAHGATKDVSSNVMNSDTGAFRASTADTDFESYGDAVADISLDDLEGGNAISNPESPDRDGGSDGSLDDSLIKDAGPVSEDQDVQGVKEQNSLNQSMSNAVSGWQRIYGQHHFDTMLQVSQAGWASSDHLVIATDSTYWDALAANSLAGALQCPVLLTSKTKLSSQALHEIKRLGATKAYICGGPIAISSQVDDQIKRASCDVQRVYGQDQQGTSLEIAKLVHSIRPASGVIIATSWKFQDALSIAPYSYKNAMPVLICDAGSNTLSSGILSFIKSIKASTGLIVGGPVAVSSSVEGQLKSSGVASVERVYGRTEYETSEAIARWCIGHGMGTSSPGLATGMTFYDALTGAGLCGKNNSVLLVASNYNRICLTGFISEQRSQIAGGYVFGGPIAVSPSVYNTLMHCWKNGYSADYATDEEAPYRAIYNYEYYRSKYSDVKNVFGNDRAATLSHFLNSGRYERRQGSANFDVRSYYNQYEDLRRAFGVKWPSYYDHYLSNGQYEGRAGTGCTSLRGWQFHNVSWQGQPNNYYCGPASGTMILNTIGAHWSASGVPLNVWNLAGYMRTDAYGYTSFHDRMFQTGMNGWLGRNAYTTVHTPSYAHARDLILRSYDRGMAAALDAQERRGGPHYNGHNNATFSHIIVVDGYNNVNDRVIFADPGARVLWGGAREKFEYPSLNTFITTYCQREIMGDGRQHIGIYAPV